MSRQHATSDNTAIFFYPLVQVPVPIQLGKMASKSNELGFFISVHVLYVKLISKEEKVRTRQDAFISLW